MGRDTIHPFVDEGRRYFEWGGLRLEAEGTALTLSRIAGEPMQRSTERTSDTP